MPRQPARFSALMLFFSQKAVSSDRCIDFTRELEASLDLLGFGFLAKYFSKIIAATAALIAFLIFAKAYEKPKRLLSLTIPPVVYLVTWRLFDHLVKNVFSYCF